MARELATERFVGAISESLGVDDAPLRASLISSQGIGIAMARYILRVEPLASMAPEALIEAIAPDLPELPTRPTRSESVIPPRAASPFRERVGASQRACGALVPARADGTGAAG